MLTFSVEPSSSLIFGSITNLSIGLVNFLISHHNTYNLEINTSKKHSYSTVPSVEAVKNSEAVLLEIHIVLYTGSMWDTDRFISPSGLPPFLSSHQHTYNSYCRHYTKNFPPTSDPPVHYSSPQPADDHP